MAFVHPVYGLLGYYFDYYLHPPLQWWGKDLPDLRWSLAISVVTVSAFFLRQNILPELRVKQFPQTKWLILLVFTSLLVTLSPLPVWQEKSWEKVFELAKLASLSSVSLFKYSSQFISILLYALSDPQHA